MKFVFTALMSVALLLCVRPLQAQQPAVSYGEKIKLYSSYLKDSMEALIYLPQDYQKSSIAYPVIYLLDGNYYYTMVTQAIRLLTDVGSIPPCILVGISAKNRVRDFTTPKAKGVEPPMPMAEAGGIDRFLGFLQKDLAPYIGVKYRTVDYRLIIGHSLGGIVSMYSLYKTPGFYKAHVLIDASLWWNDGEVGKAAIQYLKTTPGYQGKLLWIRDKIPHEVWFPINLLMHDYFLTQRPKGLQFIFRELEGEDHSTVIYPGAYMAIRDLFKDYKFVFTQSSTITSFNNYYDSLSKELGFNLIASELGYNNLQHILGEIQGNAGALEASLLWLSNYPNSAWAHETLATCYLGKGDKENALKHVKKALEEDPQRESVKELLRKIK